MADEKPMEGVLVTDGIMDFAPDSCQVHLIVIQTSQQEPKYKIPGVYTPTRDETQRELQITREVFPR